MNKKLTYSKITKTVDLFFAIKKKEKENSKKFARNSAFTIDQAIRYEALAEKAKSGRY
jgi:hypothetical protein